MMNTFKTIIEFLKILNYNESITIRISRNHTYEYIYHILKFHYIK